jgi:predicted RNase H-like nuclease (RuvC/YqgF family)
MSESEVPETPEAALELLEQAVESLMGELDSLKRGVEAERQRVEKLEGAIHQLQADGDDPTVILDRLGAAEERNLDLESRIEKGREAAERLLARVRFLEAKS